MNTQEADFFAAAEYAEKRMVEIEERNAQLFDLSGYTSSLVEPEEHEARHSKEHFRALTEMVQMLIAQTLFVESYELCFYDAAGNYCIRYVVEISDASDYTYDVACEEVRETLQNTRHYHFENIIDHNALIYYLMSEYLSKASNDK